MSRSLGTWLPWCSSKRTRHHKERAAPPQEIGHPPHHAEERRGDGDPEPREKALVQITCVREAERNAGNKDLRYLPVAGISEFCHKEGAKQHFFTKASGDSHH